MYIYSLLDHHVSTAHITSVIESVLKLAGKTRSKLPRTSTVNKMNIKRLSLYQKQLRGVISADKSYSLETKKRKPTKTIYISLRRPGLENWNFGLAVFPWKKPVGHAFNKIKTPLFSKRLVFNSNQSSPFTVNKY